MKKRTKIRETFIKFLFSQLDELLSLVERVLSKRAENSKFPTVGLKLLDSVL